jgi:4-nitrophenyl phosphatase
VDGVLFEGQNILPGAFELVSYLRQSGTPHIYLSNNTTFPLEHHIQKLSRLGAPVSPFSIITAALVTAQVLAGEAEQGALCLVIGEQGLVEALSEAGLEVTQTDYENAQYVVIGMDRWLTYEKLKCAALAIRRGAVFISSNPDPTYPDGTHLLPASGAVQAALEATTGVKARVTGKPATPGFEIALQRLGIPQNEAAILGDQLAIDIQGAAHTGIKAFLVLSSLCPEYHLGDGLPVPDAVFTSAADFYQHWIQR